MTEAAELSFSREEYGLKLVHEGGVVFSECVLVTEAGHERLTESLGYETLYRSAGYSNHVHALPDLGRLDFVYVDGETGRLLFSGGATLQLAEHRVPVPRPEHLVAMKVHAMKNDPTRTLREMADIQFLLSLPSIDEAEVRAYFEQSGLLERYLEIKRLG